MTFDLYLRFAAALVFVLGLIALAAWAVRKAGMGSRAGARGKSRRRLGIVEIAPLDAKRRLVLVRRDDVEHLLLLGTASETVVETGIACPDTGRPSDTTPDRSDGSQGMFDDVLRGRRDPILGRPAAGSGEESGRPRS